MKRRAITIGLVCAALMAGPAGDAQAGQTLYYNESGGRRYHKDASCASVDPQYLPMTKFNASELQIEPYSRLTACNVCIEEGAADSAENAAKKHAPALLYHNPDGGKLYHIDDNCYSVDAKYLPLSPFPALSLGREPYRDKEPCRHCVKDGSIRFYYNAQGGKRYHSVSACSSVDPAYLPLAEFQLEERGKAPYDSLEPCPPCLQRDEDAMAQSTLHYNPQGGKHYHEDPNCDSVDPQWLPLKAFKREELGKQPYKLLTPCRACCEPEA